MHGKRLSGSSKPAIRYQDIRRNVAKIRGYLPRGGGLDGVLTEQSWRTTPSECALENRRWVVSRQFDLSTCASVRFLAVSRLPHLPRPFDDIARAVEAALHELLDQRVAGGAASQ
jgi:hypothetical protein